MSSLGWVTEEGLCLIYIWIQHYLLLFLRCYSFLLVVSALVFLYLFGVIL